jgi:hypothetical protein
MTKEMEPESEQEQCQDSWMEEITLTVAERKTLQDLEECKLDKTACNPAAPYPHPEQDDGQPAANCVPGPAYCNTPQSLPDHDDEQSAHPTMMPDPVVSHDDGQPAASPVMPDESTHKVRQSPTITGAVARYVGVPFIKNNVPILTTHHPGLAEMSLSLTSSFEMSLTPTHEMQPGKTAMSPNSTHVHNAAEHSAPSGLGLRNNTIQANPTLTDDHSAAAGLGLRTNISQVNITPTMDAVNPQGWALGTIITKGVKSSQDQA